MKLSTPMTLEFKPTHAHDNGAIFDVIKETLFEHIDEVFGWDDGFQNERLQRDYQPEWFHWVEVSGERRALVCFKRYEGGLHLHLILVFKKFQAQGLGRQVMQKLQAIARKEARDVTLSSFKCNTGALRFYRNLGYKIEAEEEHFLTFRLPFTN